MTENIVIQREFAKIINRKEGYVSDLKKAGRLVLTADGKKVLVAESLELIKQSADLSKVGVVERHENERAEKTHSDSEPKQDFEKELTQSGKAGNLYQQSKAIREKYNALSAKLEYDKAIGKVLDADDIAKSVLNAATVMRSRLENMPDRYAPQFAAEQDPLRIKSIFMDAIETMLTEMSRQFKKIATEHHEPATN